MTKLILFLLFRNNAVRSTVLTLLVAFCCHNVHAQLSSKYTFATGSNMTSLNGSGTSLGTISSAGSVVTNVPIGFSFTFNCNTYTTIGVSSNGFIWFGSGTVSATQYTPLSSQTGESGTVAGIVALWACNMTSASYWTYKTTGSSGSYKLAIEWYDCAPSAGGMIAQIDLDQGTNTIELHYNDAQYGVSGSSSGQIGIRAGDLNSTDYENRTGAIGTATSGTADNQTVTISTGSYPNNGVNWNYTYSGTSCCTPPGTNASNFSATNVNDGALTATVNFTRGATGTGGASVGVIVIGADGAYPSAPTNGTVYTGASTVWSVGTAVNPGNYLVYASTTAGDGVTSIPINLSGLTSGHSYYFSVFEYSTTGSAACYETTPLQGGFCIGAPAAATITSSSNPICPSSGATLSLSGPSASTSYTYSWLYGATSGSETTPAVGTSSTYTTPAPLTRSPSYYTCIITCPNTGDVTTSSELNQTQSSFLNCYCQYGSFTTPTAADEVTNVTLAGNTVTLNNTPPAATYTLYTSQVPDLSQGSSYTLHVTDGTSTRRNNFAAWIDWDQNGVFGNNANEYLGVFTGEANGYTANFPITVPLTSLQGTTAMRVVFDNQNGTTGFSNSAPNCTFSASPGETLDFRVSVAGCSGPGTQASGFVTDPSPTTTSCNVQFTRGNGTGGMLVVCKAGSTPTGPTPGTAYGSPNANITAGGSTTAAGSFVIYNSNSPASGQVTVPATNLTPGTTYYFAAYEWNSAADCYDLSSPASGTCVIPLCIQPGTQVSGVSAGTPATTSATLTWTAGSGDHTLIILKQGSAVSGTPALTTGYTDNLNYNYGSPGGSLIGTGNYVMFGDAGTANATSATITGLTPSITYYYAVYTYYAATHCYDLSSAQTGNFTTASCSPSTPASGASLCLDYTTGTLTFTRGSGTNVLVVGNAGSAVSSNPVYNTTYTANASFGSGTAIGTGYVVYNGSSTGTVTVPITNLTQGTTYYFNIYEYNASPNCYNVASPTTATNTTKNAGSYTSSTATQNTSTVVQNALAQQIIGLQIVVGGGQQQAATLNNIIFTTGGSTNATADITTAKIYYTGTNSTYTNATQFGSTFTSFSGNLTATGDFALATGTNYFWVVYDVNVNATLGDVLDATIVSANITDNTGTSDRTPTVGSPTGSRSVVAATYCTCGYSRNDCTYLGEGGLTSLSFGTLNYSGSGCAAATYQNLTSSVSGTVAAGSTYTLSNSVYSSVLTYYVQVWVDWNDNGLFTDAGENIYPSNYPGSLSVTVPAGAINGAHTLRVRTIDDFYGGGANPCGTYSGSYGLGAAYDFTINVTGGVAGGGGSQATSCATLAPTVTTPVSYVQNATPSQLSASGSGLLWYTSPSGGSSSSTAPTPTTTAGGTTTYYVSQTTSCQGPLTQIAVDVTVPSCCTAPSTQATVFGSNSINSTAGTANVTFTRGNGTGGVIVVAHQNNPVGSTPSSGTTYTANSVFGSGSTTGSGDYVVYSSSTAGDGVSMVTVPLSNLTGGATYYFSIFEYNSGSTCYLLPGLTGSIYLAPPCSSAPTPGTATPVTASLCPNNGTTLNLTGYSNTVSGITFQWQYSPDNSNDYTNVVGGTGATTASYTTPTLTNGTSGNVPYYYQCLVTCSVTSQAASSSTGTVTVTPAVALATANGVSGSTSACNNVSLNLATPAVATSYSWSSNPTGFTSSIAAPSVVPTATTSYTVTTTTGSCVATSTVSVIINPAALTITPSSPTIAIGSNISLTASAASANGSVTYAWQNPGDGSLTPLNLATVTANPLVSETYSVTATDGSGCQRSGSVTVNVRSGTTGSVACGYTFGTPAATWNSIQSSANVQQFASAGSYNYTIDLSISGAAYSTFGLSQPFSFDYNGLTYNQFGVNGNGFMYFGTAPTASENNPISTATESYDGAIAAFGAGFSGGPIYYLVQGTYPNRTLTVQWGTTVVHNGNSPGSSVTLTSTGTGYGFSIILYEHGVTGTTTNPDQIQLSYSNQSVEGIGFNNSSGQVGLRGATNADYNNLNQSSSNQVTSTSTSAGTSNSASITFGAATWFNSNILWTYTPTITTPYITPTGTQNTCNGVGVTLTGNSTLPAYPSAFPPATWQWLLAGSPASGTNNTSTYTAVPATAGNYFYSVKVTNGSNCTRTSYATPVVSSACGVINFSGTLSSVNTTYGTASSNTTFTASGTGLSTGITVTAPTGFEVSTTSPTTGFGPTATISESGGTAAATTIYVRLAAATPAGTYSGNVSLSSTGAVTQNVATASSNIVSVATLTITANDVNKTYGTTITGSSGSASFTFSGLQNSDNLGSGATVTITYGTGSAANAPVATYAGQVVPTFLVAGTGATFNPSNYNIVYDNGSIIVGTSSVAIITVTGPALVYGQGFTNGTYGTNFTVSQLPNGEAITQVTLTSNVSLTSTTPAGTAYTISASAPTGTGGFVASNYTITYNQYSSTIAQAPLTITANSTTKCYNQTTTFAGTEFTTSGLVVNANNDAVNSATITSTGAPSGSSLAGSPYTIVISNAAGSGLSNYSITYVNGSLTIYPTPAITDVTPFNTSTCGGTDGQIQLNDGANDNVVYGVTYNNGGTVGPTNYTSSSGIITIPTLMAGTYNDFVITNSNGCSSVVYASPVTISDPPAPVISSAIPTGPSTCRGSDGSIALSGSNISNGFAYTVSYYNGATLEAVNPSPVASGGVITVPGLSAGTGYNTFVVTAPNGCTSAAYPPSRGDITLSDPPTPVITSAFATGTSTCGGSNGSIQLNGLINGTTYSITYSLGGIGQPTSNLTASGGSVVIANLSAGNYNDFVATANGCNSAAYPASGIIAVNDPPQPSAPTSAGNVTICASNVPATLGASTTAGNVIDWYDASIGGNLLESSDDNYSASSAATYYTQARNVTTGCISASRTPVTLNLIANPTAYNVGGGACTPADITLSNSQTGVTYNLIRDGVSNVATLPGTGSLISFGVYNVTGIYSVTATTNVGDCPANMTGVSTVGVCTSVWNGSSSSDWFDQTNWLPAAVPNVCGVTIQFASSPQHWPVISSGESDVQIGNVKIPAGGSITVASPRTLSVCGDWTALSTTLGSFVLGDGNLVFNGGFAQTISGFTQMNVVNLNNSYGATMAPGATLEISSGLQLQTGTLDVSQGTLHLLSSASNQSSYIDNFTAGYTGILTGSIIADRYVPVAGSNQHFISSPVNGPALSQIGAWGPDGSYVVPSYNCDETVSAYGSPYGSVFEYVDGHMPNNECMLGNWEIKSAGNMVNGLGYSAYLTGYSVISVSGNANTGDLTVGNLNNSGYNTVNTLQGEPIESGWNLVGNPYPSAIDLTVDRTGSGFGNEVEVWQTSGPFAGSWQPLLITGDAGQVVIPPFQGFMVRRTGQGLGSYPFNQTERSRASDQSFYRTQSTNSLQLSVDNNGMKDITTIAFNPQATNAYDPAYDANKPDGNAGRPTLYTHMDANEWFAINTLPSLTQTAVVPMGLRPEATAAMTITPSGIETFDPTTYIYLEDKQNGTMTDLRNGAYTFTTNINDNRERFAIHFTPPAQILTSDASCEASGMINITQPGTASWKYTLADANNTAISSGSLNASSPVNINAEPGVYTLTLTDNSGYTVVKNIQVGGAEVVSASFNSSANTAQVQQKITFTGNTPDASTYNWNFGDGATASGQTTAHSYKQEGVYNVELNVNSAAGCSSTSTRSIVITSGTATGVSNLNNAADIDIWSNDNRVYIDFSKQTSVNAEIDMYNVLGQLIDHETFGRSTLYSREITNLDAAYLIVKVMNNDQVTTRKVFIANDK